MRSDIIDGGFSVPPFLQPSHTLITNSKKLFMILLMPAIPPVLLLPLKLIISFWHAYFLFFTYGMSFIHALFLYWHVLQLIDSDWRTCIMMYKIGFSTNDFHKIMVFNYAYSCYKCRRIFIIVNVKTVTDPATTMVKRKNFTITAVSLSNIVVDILVLTKNKYKNLW